MSTANIEAVSLKTDVIPVVLLISAFPGLHLLPVEMAAGQFAGRVQGSAATFVDTILEADRKAVVLIH